jgi:hypothetical protein
MLNLCKQVNRAVLYGVPFCIPRRLKIHPWHYESILPTEHISYVYIHGTGAVTAQSV